jgi:hypothetical protein
MLRCHLGCNAQGCNWEETNSSSHAATIGQLGSPIKSLREKRNVYARRSGQLGLLDTTNT